MELIDPDPFPDPLPPPPPEDPTETDLPRLDYPPLPDKVSVGVVVFSYDGKINDRLRLWSIDADRALRAVPRVAEVQHAQMVGYGAERVRNKALADALDAGFDYVVMLDNDMWPDFHSREPDQVPFLPAALEFALDHDGPCLVGAPYCAGGEDQRVLVSRFVAKKDHMPDGVCNGGVLEAFSRSDAATRRGMELVPCLPTGCLLVDTRVARLMAPPWFTYEYRDQRWTEFASTEDTTFTRNLFYLGIPSYVAWQSWAGHVKETVVGRPRIYPQEAVPRNVRKAWERAAKKGGG